MSKKLIAIASAAALALAALVAVPANATAISSVTIDHSGSDSVLTVSQTDSDSAVSAETFAVDRNVIFGSVTDTSTRTAVRATVATAAAAAVTVTSTGGVKISASVTDGAGAALKVDAGAQTLSGTTSTANLNYVFYAWNTSTTAGSVTVETASSRITFYVKGLVYEAYNLVDVTFPSSLYVGQTGAKITFKVTDPYGNAITTGTGITPTGFGASFAAATYSSTTKLWSSTISSITGDNVAMNVAITPLDLSTSGFAKPVKAAFKLVSAGDLETQNTSLTAQVASLTASVAALKADFNALATKYNKLVKKSKRVATK